MKRLTAIKGLNLLAVTMLVGSAMTVAAGFDLNDTTAAGVMLGALSLGMLLDNIFDAIVAGGGR